LKFKKKNPGKSAKNILNCFWMVTCNNSRATTWKR